MTDDDASEEEADAVFDELDFDRSGSINLREFKTRLHEVVREEFGGEVRATEASAGRQPAAGERPAGLRRAGRTLTGAQTPQAAARLSGGGVLLLFVCRASLAARSRALEHQRRAELLFDAGRRA